MTLNQLLYMLTASLKSLLIILDHFSVQNKRWVISWKMLDLFQNYLTPQFLLSIWFYEIFSQKLRPTQLDQEVVNFSYDICYGHLEDVEHPELDTMLSDSNALNRIRAYDIVRLMQDIYHRWRSVQTNTCSGAPPIGQMQKLNV